MPASRGQGLRHSLEPAEHGSRNKESDQAGQEEERKIEQYGDVDEETEDGRDRDE